MNVKTLLAILIGIGLVLIALGVYIALKPVPIPPNQNTPTSQATPPTQSISPTGQSYRQSIALPYRNYSASDWDEYGVGFDPDPRYICIYMRKVGYITYTFPLTEIKASTMIVSTRLSSELRNTTSSESQFSSDVTLSVNGVEQQTQNVMPDDVVGQDYTWQVSTNLLKPNADNSITLSVKRGARNQNGIAIYSPIQITIQ